MIVTALENTFRHLFQIEYDCERAVVQWKFSVDKNLVSRKWRPFKYFLEWLYQQKTKQNNKKYQKEEMKATTNMAVFLGKGSKTHFV